jgi:uncharacterized protein (TIRG00374 family)
MSRKHRWAAAQGLVTIALLALLVRGLDLHALGDLFLRLPGWFYGVSLAVVIGGQVAYAWRWRLLLDAAGVRVPFAVLLRQYFIGIFLNNFLLSTVGGDIAKVYLLGREHGYRVVTASVLLDRMLGIGLLALFATMALWSVPMRSPVVAAARLAVTAVAIGALAVLLVAGAGVRGLRERVAGLGPRASSLAERLQRLRGHMTAALTRPAVVLQAGGIIAGYFLALTALYVSFIALHGGRVPSVVLLFGVVATTAVLTNVPVSLNGVGLREQLHAVLLVPLGVPREMAVGIALLLFGHLLIASLIGLAFWIRTPALPTDVAAPIEV